MRLRCHFHNTRNTGIANACAAVEAGVEALDASVGGIGGCPFAPAATGNIRPRILYMLTAWASDGIDLERRSRRRVAVRHRAVSRLGRGYVPTEDLLYMLARMRIGRASLSPARSRRRAGSRSASAARCRTVDQGRHVSGREGDDVSYRLGVDVGGTFTDLLLVDEKSGRTWCAKVPSTPADQSVGVLQGDRRICRQAGIEPRTRSST